MHHVRWDAIPSGRIVALCGHISGTWHWSNVATRKNVPWRNEIVNHSPTGLSSGYGGLGLAQCALAILTDAVGGNRALACYRAFKWQCIAVLPMDEPWGNAGRQRHRLGGADRA